MSNSITRSANSASPAWPVLETRLRQAQTDRLAPIDLVSTLVSDELLRRQDRLLERRHKQAGFRDPARSLDGFDFDFNKKMNRALIHDLATGRFIAQREDAFFLGPGKSHLAQAIRPWRDPAGLPRRLSRQSTGGRLGQAAGSILAKGAQGF